MKNIFKGKFKRVMAAMLSLLMVFGIAPISAFAASDTITMTFDYSYQSDGSEILYHGSFTSPNGVTAGGEGDHRVLIYGNGEVVYCIQPGVHLLLGDVLTANASEAWNALSYDQQNGIKTVLAFGYTGNSGNLMGNRDCQIVATQMLLWEIGNGWRDANTFDLYNSAIFDAFCRDGYNAEVAAVYNQIVSIIKQYPVMPSFANGQSYDRVARTGAVVSQSNYDKVYSGQLFSGETIYERFNLQHPADFRGHSLSVSDVIVLHKDGTNQAWYVDSFGFKQVPEFFADNPLKKVEELMEDDYGMIDGIINNGDRRKDQEEKKPSVMEKLQEKRKKRLKLRQLGRRCR